MRYLSTLAAIGAFCAFGGTAPAEIKVDEQVIAPAGRWIGAAVSPRGVHVAVLALKGSRSVVLIDGVEGPLFDQLVDVRGQAYSAPIGGMQIWPSNSAPIVFSDDGAHCAYFGKTGDQYVAILDGKEFSRGPFGTISPPYSTGGLSGHPFGTLSFSPGGGHVFYNERDKGQYRVIMDGKAQPWSTQPPQVIFSPDGQHYAYVGTQADAAKTKWNVIDGRQVQYVGDNLQFANGHLASVLTENNLDTLIVDNKPVMRAASIRPVWASPNGALIAAVMLPRAGVPSLLTINGKPVPGTEGARVKDVYFSPDGKRYAAFCETATLAKFMLIDGKRGQTYEQIHDTFSPPRFTPDSSRLVYVAVNSGKWFVITDSQESNGFDWLSPPVVGGNAIIAYNTGDGSGRKFDVVVDGKVLSPSRTRDFDLFAFSPDGKRYGFVGGTFGSIYKTLVVDGTEFAGASVTEGEREIPYFQFSPDGAHIAFFGRDMRDNKRGGLWIDRKLVFQTDGVYRIHFTPDSQHLLWASLDTNSMNTLYVDGLASVKFQASGFDSMKEAREMNIEGALTFVTLKDGAVVRYRVTAPSQTSILTMLSGRN